MKTENMFANCQMNVEKNVTEKNKISESKKNWRMEHNVSITNGKTR